MDWSSFVNTITGRTARAARSEAKRFHEQQAREGQERYRIAEAQHQAELKKMRQHSEFRAIENQLGDINFRIYGVGDYFLSGGLPGELHNARLFGGNIAEIETRLNDLYAQQKQLHTAQNTWIKEWRSKQNQPSSPTRNDEITAKPKVPGIDL